MVRKKLDLTGQIFGRLTVIRECEPYINPNTGAKAAKYLCQCECGIKKEIVGASLKNGETKSCGCYQIEATIKNHTKHGYSNTPTYVSWRSMVRRCSEFPDYKNISVCDRWLTSFENFYADMGERPEGTTLDRYPNQKGNYEPSNCRWATPKQQANNVSTNRLLTYQGITKTRGEWAEELELPIYIIKERIDKLGWSTEKALTTPIKSKNTLLTFQGNAKSIRDWALETGISYSTIHRRISYGWSVEEALEKKQRQKINQGTQRNNTSGHKGVSWDEKSNKWQAYITVNKKRIHLGRFPNKEDAVEARKLAEQQYHQPLLKTT